MKVTQSSVAALGLALIPLIGAMLLSSCTRTEAKGIKAAGAPILRVEAVVVRTGTGNLPIRITGQVEPMHVATVSAEVAARIESRPVERGTSVSVGQVLAVLDSAQASAQRDQARAAVSQAVAARGQWEAEYARARVETQAAMRQANAQMAAAKAGMEKSLSFTRLQEQRQAESGFAQAKADEELAKIERDRYARLVMDGAAAQQILDRADAALKTATARSESAGESVSLAHEGARREDRNTANAQVEMARAGKETAGTRGLRLTGIRRQIESLAAQEAQARASLRQSEIVLQKHTIIAPFAGVVLQTTLDKGDRALPGTPLLRLADIRRVKAAFAVPEDARRSLSLNQDVRLYADAVSKQPFRGRVSLLGFEANRSDRAFPLEVIVDNADERLLPGMVVRISLTDKSKGRWPIIPLESVASEEGKTVVYVLGNGIARRRVVTLGAPVGADVEVHAGVRAGETIARTPQRLSDGSAIRTGSVPDARTTE